MNKRALVFLLIVAALPSFTSLIAADYDAHDVVDLGHGVYGVVRKDGPVHPEPNVLFVVNDDDVLVVDSSILPCTSRLVIGEIRKRRLVRCGFDAFFVTRAVERVHHQIKGETQ